MVKVSMTKDWETPDGEVVEMVDYRTARAWILLEAARRKLRVAGYERTIIKPEIKAHVVDFGSYGTFGLIQFETEAEMREGVRDGDTLEAPPSAPDKPKPVVLGTLPMSVNELELAIHAACDQGRWKWTVRLDGKSLVLEEPFPEGS